MGSGGPRMGHPWSLPFASNTQILKKNVIIKILAINFIIKMIEHFFYKEQV